MSKTMSKTMSETMSKTMSKMLAMFDKEHESDTMLDRLGSAKKSSPFGLLTLILVIIGCIAGFLYFNFKAMGLATGATGPIVKHGLAYTFAQPFYSFWSIYYVLLGHKS
ncbi:unnamed protein product [Pylaiella littoralis]